MNNDTDCDIFHAVYLYNKKTVYLLYNAYENVTRKKKVKLLSHKEIGKRKRAPSYWLNIVDM